MAKVAASSSLPHPSAPSAPEWAADGDDVARAVGMVMVQAGCPARRALGLLRACAELSDRKLSDIAVAVIHRNLRFDDRARVRAAVSLMSRVGRVDQLGMRTELRAVVECLLTAHYSEQEIVDYLTGPIGVTEAEAVRAVQDCAGARDVAAFGDVRRPG